MYCKCIGKQTDVFFLHDLFSDKLYFYVTCSCSVKPAVFDLFLAVVIAVYLTVIYLLATVREIWHVYFHLFVLLCPLFTSPDLLTAWLSSDFYFSSYKWPVYFHWRSYKSPFDFLFPYAIIFHFKRCVWWGEYMRWVVKTGFVHYNFKFFWLRSCMTWRRGCVFCDLFHSGPDIFLRNFFNSLCLSPAILK